MTEAKLTCWSCRHCRTAGCEIPARKADWDADKGDQCAGFVYEPGSDEAEALEPESQPPEELP